jgi:hypothetical protein
VKIFLWLLLAACSGVMGFYYGVRVGANYIGELTARNEASDSLWTMGQSLDVMARNDLAASNARLQAEFEAALTRLGTVSKAVSYWKCSDRDLKTLAAAREFRQAHPDRNDDPRQPFLEAGLSFCSRTERH